MVEHRYQVEMNVNGSRISVNVFTPGLVNKEELRPLALKRGIEFMKELGSDVAAGDIELIGYKHCEVWE